MVCDVCWTDSWQPCEQGTPNAIPDPSVVGGWMICEYCQLYEKYENGLINYNNLLNKLDVLIAVWSSKPFNTLEEQNIFKVCANELSKVRK